MTAAAASPGIDPVLILSTGRCGSTLVSEMLNRHPRVLSLSEFFVPLGMEAYAWPRPTGERMWRILSRQSPALHAMLKDGHVVDEGLYPHDAPGSRYRADTMPPIIAVTLPHLTDRPEELLDALEPLVRGRPRMALADHYRALFAELACRFGRRVWVERSGGTLMHAAKLLRLFPEARVIHVYRDGRDTAMSMSHHHNFRVLLGAMLLCRRFGIDPRKGFRKAEGSLMDVLMEALVFPRLNIDKVAALPTLEDFGAFWSDMIEVGTDAIRRLPAERRLDLRFEDIQESPRAKLTELIRFIDPSLEDAAWLDEAAAMPRAARSRFDTLPPDRQAALTQACAPGLERLGYPL